MIWGFGNLSGIEKVHTDFLKRILKVKQSTPSVMLYLGRVPLSIRIKKRVIGYWYDITNSDNKLSSIVYRLILQDNVHTSHSYEWLKFVKTISMTVDLLIYGRVNSLTVLNICFYPELKQLYHHNLSRSGSK